MLTLASRRPGDLFDATRALARAATARIDLSAHRGVHPRFGVVDVVPFVPLPGGHPAGPGDDLGPALAARDAFARWAGDVLGVPCFLYGPQRSLPEVRRLAFDPLPPDTGPARRHPTAGACAVGARPALVAYNLWLDTADVSVARELAASVRTPVRRTLGLLVGERTQVSCNLVDPRRVGPVETFDAVARAAASRGVGVTGAELVGLVPADVADAVPPGRRLEVDVTPDRSVEARLGAGR